MSAGGPAMLEFNGIPLHDLRDLRDWHTFRFDFDHQRIVALLTDSSGGTADDTIAAITAAANAGSADEAPTENAIADLAAKVNFMLNLSGSKLSYAGTGVTVFTPQDAVGGIWQIDTGGTDNNEWYLGTPMEMFSFAAGKPCYAELRIQITTTITNADFFFGFTDVAPAADLIADSHTGLATIGAAGQLAGWGKVAANSYFTPGNRPGAHASGNTDYSSLTNITAAASTWYTFGIAWDPANQQIRYYLDDVLKFTSSALLSTATADASPRPLSEMGLVFGLKTATGAAASAQVDYIFARQKR